MGRVTILIGRLHMKLNNQNRLRYGFVILSFRILNIWQATLKFGQFQDNGKGA